ncbi:MAG: hypothetical protein JW888_12180 [Pirellulales bacterium]|nr:hypothetical protein [Pirellulales bacterium]
MKKPSLMGLLRRVHGDQEGSVSLETVLVLCAIAIPVLIVMIKWGWPMIKSYFQTGMQDLQSETTTAVQ